MGTKGKGLSKKREPLEKEKKELTREEKEMEVEPIIESEIEKVEEAEATVGEAREITEEEKKLQESKERLAAWKPKTRLGLDVKEGKITKIDEILEKDKKILEPEIVELLLPSLEYELINIGHARGKFGGGKRRVWRQTQKKTAEGNVPKFSTMAVVGDKAGHVGVGYGKARETLPAREKAIRDAKLNIFKVPRGCGSFDCSCNEPHSIPAITEGKCASAKVVLMPAPRGTGIVADDDIKKIFRLAGIKDIYVQSRGKTRTKLNHVYAVIDALQKLKTFETKA
ncbi:MAG: 30S ribosomal protein S5 [Candidatus Pacearchaeota archaeon]